MELGILKYKDADMHIEATLMRGCGGGIEVIEKGATADGAALLSSVGLNARHVKFDLMFNITRRVKLTNGEKLTIAQAPFWEDELNKAPPPLPKEMKIYAELDLDIPSTSVQLRLTRMIEGEFFIKTGETIMTNPALLPPELAAEMREDNDTREVKPYTREFIEERYKKVLEYDPHAKLNTSGMLSFNGLAFVKAGVKSPRSEGFSEPGCFHAGGFRR